MRGWKVLDLLRFYGVRLCAVYVGYVLVFYYYSICNLYTRAAILRFFSALLLQIFVQNGAQITVLQ